MTFTLFPYGLYLISATITSFAVLSGIQYAAWGAPVTLGHCAAANGVLVLLVASFVSLIRARLAAALALIGSLAIVIYIVPMLQLTDPRFVASPFALGLSAVVLLVGLYAVVAILEPDDGKLPPTLQPIFPKAAAEKVRILAVPAGLMICSIPALIFLVLPGQRDVWSPEMRSDLVVYFDASATNEEIIGFNKNVVGIPIPEQGPTAHMLLPEISNVTSVSSVDGHRGYAIGFWPNVSADAERAVIERIWDSPIVYTVLEDVAPADITELPTPRP